ncbi:LCP family protein [Pseudonocardia humida]|uniref:LCP family protein n=1 Tax=Pseudonocardia humida TaxID=2800819 RepID=A0ABT1A470_9PSEU|nr:LCP family protein [Pseudonocardia humida]MCO1657808.1 LCP family protein [Pseudonocardia humida]
MDARTIGRVALRTVVAMASVATLIAVGLVWNLQHRLEVGRTTSTAAVPDAVPTPVGESFTALLVGLDARTDAAGDPLPQELLDALHAGPDEGQLHTDTIMLLHVPAGGTAVAISIPRDSFVPIAGAHGTHKINSAYRRGKARAEEALAAQGIAGPELDRRGREAGRATLVATVQDLTGVTVDHFAEINLAGFVELTEALGGVPVCLNQPVRDSYSGVDLPAGQQTVSGAGALAFVRQRHGLDGGDLDRIARQQAFAAGLAQRLTDAGTLSDPARLDRLVDVATRHVVLDSGWSIQDLPEQLRRLAGDPLVFRTIPTGRPDMRTPTDGVAVEIDPRAVRDFVAAEIDAVEPGAGTDRISGDTGDPAEAPGRVAPTGSAAVPPPPAPTAPTTAPTTAPPAISTAGPSCVD